jgi:hypothetical protein
MAEQQQTQSEKLSAELPDFFTDPNAVLKDDSAIWRFGKRPDYAKTRKVYAECKFRNLIISRLRPDGLTMRSEEVQPCSRLAT